MRYTISGLQLEDELSLIGRNLSLLLENIADTQFKINGSRDNLRDC